jgi:hypothetical protein
MPKDGERREAERIFAGDLEISCRHHDEVAPTCGLWEMLDLLSRGSMLGVADS